MRGCMPEEIRLRAIARIGQISGNWRRQNLSAMSLVAPSPAIFPPVGRWRQRTAACRCWHLDLDGEPLPATCGAQRGRDDHPRRNLHRQTRLPFARNAISRSSFVSGNSAMLYDQMPMPETRPLRRIDDVALKCWALVAVE